MLQGLEHQSVLPLDYYIGVGVWLCSQALPLSQAY